MKNRVDDAFRVTPREIFLPATAKDQAGLDTPLQIGFGQTNSQPTTVRMMLEWLEVEPGQKVLDVGSGSGWTTALLAHLVGNEGRVIAVERVPELVDFGRSNCESMGIKNVTFVRAGVVFGWPNQAPYDRILVSAAADSMPQELIEQLAPGGRMVVPVQNDIHVLAKDKTDDIDETVYGGFVFVPLVPDKEKR